ncbi:organic hydroperoxide resistance protein [Saccharibacillus sp. CPCC 101409]|uniref:organic hydroperoxide resistance protein n=1 Tax=Saccharibacillus sp. CPCC 101409 TaxID=3058041 RepID=UPI0026711831|nr:organic hydroperoxide resistance protein [Saccharibacillus sp. CPCC 101409]MDO3408627.1 organic hydroperoxide resistance protein [Saccharibacillus sp. CPCC 101409]
MDALYTAKATARRGGRSGVVESADGALNLQLSVPKELDGDGGTGTNPEELFAAGYSACFESALANIAGKEGIDVPDIEVTCHIKIGKDPADGGFQLAAKLEVRIPGLDPEKAKELAEKAHEFCPYSKATRGNIDVELSVI